MKLKLPLPLWVATKSDVFSGSRDPEGRFCCFLFSSESNVKAFVESHGEFTGAQFRSMDKAGVRDFFTVVQIRGITHVIIDHETEASVTFAIADILTSLGPAPTSN